MELQAKFWQGWIFLKAAGGEFTPLPLLSCLEQGWGNFFLSRAIWTYVTSFEGYTKVST